ncbi:MAG: ATP-binding domain-containing protein [Chloroflexi bacterium]|nr:ATP-binding domain-containing protein [Chloroflexota bacterium]
MARIYPQRLSPETNSYAERQLYEALADTLPNDYCVFHSVRWLLRDGYSGTRDGEADFVVAHPDKGLLVIEVKGGSIGYDGALDQWSSNGNPIKDPFAQAQNNKYSLLSKLKEAPFWRDRFISLGHAVAFPDVTVRGDLRMDAPREIILDRADMADLPAAIERIYRAFADDRSDVLGSAGITALIDVLSPSREIRRLLSADISHEAQEMLELTDNQFRLLDILTYQRRVAVSGCAGSGKTTLAIEQARRLHAQGFRVLLTCFNVHMAEYFRSLGLPSEIVIDHFHHLAADYCRQAGMALQEPSDDEAARFYDELPERLMEAIEVIGPQFDAIVVDEGQDLDLLAWTSLQALLCEPDTGILYVFYDDNQTLYPRAGAIPSELRQAALSLTDNLRNTQAIHQAFLPFYHAERMPRSVGPAGRVPEIQYYQNEVQLKSQLRGLLNRLLVAELVPAGNITILTPRSAENSPMASWKILGNNRFNLSGSLKPGEIRVRSIYKFKGLESAVVIVVGLSTRDFQDLNKLLYVACSRACNHLFILAEEGLPDEYRARLAAPRWQLTES